MKRTISGICGGLVVFLLLTGVPAARAGELVIIVNPNVTVERLPRNSIAEIYMNTKTRWDNGDKIRVTMLKTGATHDAFVRELVKTTSDRLTTLWKKVVFTGAGTPPKILKDETEVLAFVTETPGAIGYIAAATPHERVKVLALTE
jgi:ABC-type phosphate transport system substrate-binding protein